MAQSPRQTGGKEGRRFLQVHDVTREIFVKKGEECSKQYRDTYAQRGYLQGWQESWPPVASPGGPIPELSLDTVRALTHAVETSLTKRDIEMLEPMIGRERTDRVHAEVLFFLEWLYSSKLP